MSYVVNWRGNDGHAGWHPVADLEEAAAHVERLRNVEGVNETKIFALEEVAFEFRPYYRVELAAAAAPGAGAVSFAAPAASAPVATVAPVAPVAPSAVEPDASDTPAWPAADAVTEAPEDAAIDVTTEPAGEEAGANGARRGLFGR